MIMMMVIVLRFYRIFSIKIFLSNLDFLLLLPDTYNLWSIYDSRWSLSNTDKKILRVDMKNDFGLRHAMDILIQEVLWKFVVFTRILFDNQVIFLSLANSYRKWNCVTTTSFKEIYPHLNYTNKVRIILSGHI